MTNPFMDDEVAVEEEIEELEDAVVDEEKYDNMHPTDPTLDRFNNPIVGEVSLNKQAKPNGEVSWYYNCHWMSSVHKKRFTSGFNIESGKYGDYQETYMIATVFQQMMNLVQDNKKLDLYKMIDNIDFLRSEVKKLSQSVVRPDIKQVIVMFNDSTHQVIDD
jgi:hypothetical protein